MAATPPRSASARRSGWITYPARPTRTDRAIGRRPACASEKEARGLRLIFFSIPAVSSEFRQRRRVTRSSKTRRSDRRAATRRQLREFSSRAVRVGSAGERSAEDIGQKAGWTADEPRSVSSPADLGDGKRRGHRLPVQEVRRSASPQPPAARSSNRIHDQAIATARRARTERGHGGPGRLSTMNASGRLLFADALSDAIICIDAITHLPDRPPSSRSVPAAEGRRALAVHRSNDRHGPSRSGLAARSATSTYGFVRPAIDEGIVAQSGSA